MPARLPVEIRAARGSDAAAILAINREAAPGVTPLEGSDLDELFRFSSWFGVAEAGGEVAAYLAAFPFHSPYDGEEFLWFRARYPDFLYIDQVAVAPAHRRHGIAARLYDEVEAFARSQRVPWLVCEVNLRPPNLVSLRFHERRGFAEVGTLQVSDGRFVALLARPTTPLPREEVTMDTVTSADGTRIAFWRSGSGPPLVLVHGASADHTTTWRFVLADLERNFTVHAMDRRGRGGSGDGPRHSLAREAEDVAAVVDSIGGPADLFGHSYGGLCALEAALLTPNVRRLAIYEGVPVRGADTYPPGLVERCEALHAAGDAEGVLLTVFRELVEMPPEEIELLRSAPDAWQVRLGNARTLVREMRVEQGYTFEPARFREMRTPTLLLVGERSPARELANARAVAAALPDARVAVLPGQQHAAMYTAPEVFVRELVRFFSQ